MFIACVTMCFAFPEKVFREVYRVVSTEEKGLSFIRMMNDNLMVIIHKSW